MAMKNCPFCGSGNVKVAGRPFVDIYQVSCMDERCGAEGPTATTEEGAIHKWDGRPIQMPVAEYITNTKED